MYYGKLIQLWICKYWDKLNSQNKCASIQGKYQVLESWAKGTLKGCNRKLLPQNVKSYFGGYLIDSEILKLIDFNLKYLREKGKLVIGGNAASGILKDFDEQLISCWINSVKKHELFYLGNDRSIPILNRVSDFASFNANDYINGYLMQKNEGLYLNKGGQILEYKISENICKYCFFRNICLYSYRINSQHF
ncbi:hypothetical protein ACTFJW_08985 [Clostridium cagae]|uniref:hypothetical protein n=1 Tax=Clostridium cagae TaxID=2080751 RepID=UPI003F77473F